MQHRLEHVLGEGPAGALEGALEDAGAEARILLADGGARGAADRRPGLAGDHDLLPGGGRHLRLGADDLDLVPVLQLRHQRHDAAVDLGAHAGVADVGVDGIGEVDRRCAARQGDQPALGRETEHLILEHLQPRVLEELLGIVALRQRLDGALQPAIGIRFLGDGVAGAVQLAAHVLVDGVGGDAVLGHLVHLPGADLQLDALARRADDGGVDGAVVVLLGRRDIVLEATGHHRPGGVDGAERLIAILDLVDDDAEAENVGQLLEGQRLGFHLAEHRPRLLLPAGDGRLDAVFHEQRLQRRLDLDDDAAVALEDVGQPLGDGLVAARIDVAKGELLEFLAHVLHAHAAGERRIDVHRLLGDALALLLRHVVERAHVVEAVGELDEEDAHVLRDRQQQLAQVLRLGGLPGHQVELLELGQALDQLADVGAEQIVDLLARGRGVLDRVVQQRDRDGRLVEMHVGEDRRHFERVGEIGIPRGALLMAMLLHGVDIGLVQKGFIDVGLVALDALDKLVLTHHRRGGSKTKHAP